MRIIRKNLAGCAGRSVLYQQVLSDSCIQVWFLEVIIFVATENQRVEYSCGSKSQIREFWNRGYGS